MYLCMITNWSELLPLSMLHTVYKDMQILGFQVAPRNVKVTATPPLQVPCAQSHTVPHLYQDHQVSFTNCWYLLHLSWSPSERPVLTEAVTETPPTNLPYPHSQAQLMNDAGWRFVDRYKGQAHVTSTEMEQQWSTDSSGYHQWPSLLALSPGEPCLSIHTCMQHCMLLHATADCQSTTVLADCRALQLVGSALCPGPGPVKSQQFFFQH